MVGIKRKVIKYVSEARVSESGEAISKRLAMRSVKRTSRTLSCSYRKS